MLAVREAVKLVNPVNTWGEGGIITLLVWFLHVKSAVLYVRCHVPFHYYNLPSLTLIFDDLT